MRFVFKQSYDADINLFRHSGYVRNGLILTLLAFSLPLVYLLTGASPTQLGFLIEILCFSIGAMGLMVLTGFTGQVSLGHGAFFLLGAYMVNFFHKVGPEWMPWPVALVLTVILLGVLGYLIARPTLRMTSTALAIASLLFMILVQQALIQWDFMGRADGFKPFKMAEKDGWFADLLNWLATVPGTLDPEADKRALRVLSIKGPPNYALYYISLVALLVTIWIMRNLLRSNLGRNLIAIRDSEVSARSMGVPIAHYKSLAFGISGAITGLGGALFAAKFSSYSPDNVTFVQSIVFLLIVVVGGLGSIHGAIFGAIAYVGLREMLIPGIARFFQNWGDSSGGGLIDALAAFFSIDGLGDILFALILVLILMSEPLGLYARWRKSEAYFQTFPFYRAGTFKRQRAYAKTERLK